MDPGAAERMVAKLRAFAADLDPEERELLAMLLAPGVAQAYAADDVTGFGTAAFAALPETLATALQSARLRVVDLG